LVVYSKSQNVLDFSKELEKDNKVPRHKRLLRDEDKISNNIPISDFMFSVGNFYAKEYGEYPDIVIYLSLHAINRRKVHIDKAINNLLISDSDSVVSVQEEREPMFNYGKSGLNLINPGRFRNLSFDKEKLYRFNGSIIATRWSVVKAGSLFGSKTSFIEMTSKDSLQIKESNFKK
jgi:CMP-N-acetylneuraminic acid synthetase